ncbi:MAG: UvrD-helicase domain-containing protein, partial [Oscillospiraceae bacterium]
MSDIKWTNEQRAAIESRGGALLVSAAAGSGKTAVLTARAVGRMIDGNNSIDADRLLVVTFTRAAAREMKERLTVRLGEALQNDPGNAALRRQRTLLDSACIGTIHALCFNLLRQNFQRLNLPATFRIGQEQEIVLMHDEAVDAALEAAYGTGDTAFLSLVGLFAQKRGDASLAGALLRLLEFARSHPFYLDWMDERLRLYDDVQCPADSLWSGIILCHAMRLVSSARDICRRALLHIGADETLSAYASAFAGDLSLLEKLSDLIEQGDWDGICERLATFSHTRLSPVKHAREEDREALKSQRDMVKNLVEQLRQKLFSANAAEMREDVATLRPLVGCLFGLVREIDALLLAR